MFPVSDKCAPTKEHPEFTCRFDEPLFEPSEGTTRWYELEEDRELFYITRRPIPIDKFLEESEHSDNSQTYYIRPIIDGSDELVQATFRPDPDRPRSEEGGPLYIPTLVEVNFFYY